MSTLLLRLAAPLMSWGVDSKFDRRGTERMPTKSGVVGLVAGAFGRRRDESLDDLTTLRFGVRLDREGLLLRDYQTAKSEKSAYVTQRFYLADAVFLVGLEGDEELLTQVDYALRHPAFPLFLGRRSCPPEGRVSLGIRPGVSLLQALQTEPWLAAERRNTAKDTKLRIVLDAAPQDNAVFQRDLPISFNQEHRQYGFRRISEAGAVAVPGRNRCQAEPPTTHNPMQELEEE